MDGLKISCPVDVSLPAKLMGSEGCGGGVRVSSNKADNNCEKARVSIGVNSSIERCSASINKKGSSGGGSDSSLWRKLMHSHDFVHDRLTKLRVDNSSEPQNGYSPIASPESAESPRKRGKLSRSSSNGTPRRTKLILLDETVSIPRDNDTKEICGQGSTSCLDKPFVVKQRTSCNGKRGDKRISKVPVRTFSTITSATGENAFFGAYGLKPAINDVTKLVEDLSLKNLLEGSYECPSLGKDKMKKLENTNDILLSVVKNVWSILPTKRPVQSQSSTELDTCLSRTLGSPPSSISATLLNGENIDNANALDGDLSSSSKDHCINSEIPSTPLSFPLCDAVDVLKRLGLPPSKDLDSLLQDASKPSQNSKNNLDQQRSAKQLPPRSGLPHFPWSQAFSGSSRTNSEAAKLVTGKTLCQGRWLRIANTTMSSPEGITDNFANLGSLTFNQNLVPPVLKQTIAGIKTSQTKFANITSCQCTGASVSTLQKASFVPKEPEGSPDVQDDALSCPLLLEAARTLCDIAVQSANHINPNGILRWPKKLSQKSMKARKSKLIEKPLERHGTTVSSLDLNSSNNNNNKNHVRKDSAAEHNHHHHHHHFPKPSKRLKLSTMENKKRSFPSSSSSPIESDRKHSSSSKFKNHSRMMLPPPPPTRTLQKSSMYPQKARKFP
ncbi:uncharacterized protein LOC9323987 isoform X2 [Arabidopsis lyrata subsp. lyrata]|uniref:uncharacterized protein LOC9323987 isoform X2 n=1 Tax=Arabidopsis lyrata subsp. lyrata TaxID=81972 RepID=UPI000A29DCED|nr:uncharacterized protein LOC9323987 isoform X2 [Arabidopsis lyrata subsp. lyrata]|eukprot:XP_020891202.1 uncharacterized protein LOC9323987 isoform X2 [Arabidopsis lyrata subsp. lyrata]